MRTTFDETASLYDEARPGYPDALFDDVVSLSGIPSGGTMIEVGCGTGKATLPLSRRGYGILCVELGEVLAELARRNLAAYPRAEVLTADFERTPLPDGAFDLLVSATAFHWLDPAVAYPKAASTLKPEGPSRCSGTNTQAPARTEGSSRRRRKCTRARRPRSGTGTTTAHPYPKTCPTGRTRS